MIDETFERPYSEAVLRQLQQQRRLPLRHSSRFAPRHQRLLDRRKTYRQFLSASESATLSSLRRQTILRGSYLESENIDSNSPWTPLTPTTVSIPESDRRPDRAGAGGRAERLRKEYQRCRTKVRAIEATEIDIVDVNFDRNESQLAEQRRADARRRASFSDTRSSELVRSLAVWTDKLDS